MTLSVKYQVGDVLPPELHNSGYSAGLEYPFIFGEINGQWLIWNRHTGVIAEIVIPNHPAMAFDFCGRRCDVRNGICDLTSEEISEINMLHDMEP